MNEPIELAKQRLRSALRTMRADLGSADIDVLGRQIVGRLKTLDVFASADIIHSYVDSLPGEVPTRPLIEAALARGARVVCPRVATREPPRLDHFEITGLDDLRRSPGGLSEPDPTPGGRLDLDLLDVVLVPGLGFDRAGNRLGLGGGFYDAFLAGVRATRVGLAFSLQVVDSIPHTPRDERVDLIVTESEIIECHRARRKPQQDSPK